ncbi:MAG TPA: preprotein translocase subunit SecA [Geobacterales bacterium]|nr:preprotein translocase subunit SecA [Geobacterales bacterium]
MRQKTADWKAQLSHIQDKTELAGKLNEILPEAFAVVKNACRRLTERKAEIIVREHPLLWEMIPFDVQLIGGYGLHSGRIAEMATGEGKTLVATLPIYLNALTGRGVHLVTVNDYLAARDSEWMGAIYKFLGLTVGCILHDQPPRVRREQYNCDITFGTNAEFGFDYLRDNGMAARKEEQVQRGHYFAIVDEVDSILIDEARTPLIISGPSVHTYDEQYAQWKPLVESLVRAQERLCARFLSEAEAQIKKLNPTDGSNPQNSEALEHEIGLLLFRVKIGQPKSEGLMKLLEDPENLKLMNRAELDLHKDQKKVDLYREKEELLFAIDEKGFEADLTEKGRNFVSPKDPEAFVLPELTTALHEIDAGPEPDARKRMEAKTKVQQDFETKAQKIHAISQLLKAYSLYQLDVEYVIQENKVIIVDQHTGRLMAGRRWSDGLHQAVEAKEGVAIERETQTLATITIQNYFRLYTKLAGMTGTAETEAAEFQKIYNLDVTVIPTNRPLIRKENQDMVYRTEVEKFRNAANEIKECNAKGQPVLVGTISVEKSERLAAILKKMGVKHEVLNAKNHEREAGIVSQAGRKNAVTVSTNMAGRGTDILLGGNPEFMTKDECLKKKVAERLGEEEARFVADEHFNYFTHNEQFYRVRRDMWDQLYAANKAFTDLEHDEVVGLGGLHIVATERHESRRIDNQLRGRAGRQGDPGSSRFFLSLQDDLLRIFGGEKMQNLMLRLGMEEDVPIESKMITNRIRKAQEAVEAQNFEARKHLLEYDDVNNKQRQTVYGLRRQLLEGVEQKQRVMDMMQGIVEEYIDRHCANDKHPDTWDLAALRNDILTQFGSKIDLKQLASLHRQEMMESIFDQLQSKYQEKEDLVGPDVMRQTERIVMLQVIDNQWKDHLLSMDELKQGIGLRAQGQKDPLVEYKRESFDYFTAMMDRIEDETVRYLYFLQVNTGSGPVLPFPDEDEEEEAEPEAPRPDPNEQQRLAAKSTMEDFTRNIQRKKEREMEQLQFAGGDDSRGATPVITGQKTGRNDPCPCGSGKKYKKCHGA